MPVKMSTKKLILVLLIFVPVSLLWNRFIMEQSARLIIFANIRLFTSGFLIYTALFIAIKRMTYTEKSIAKPMFPKWTFIILGIIVVENVIEYIICRTFDSTTFFPFFLIDVIWAIVFILITYYGLSPNQKLIEVTKKSFFNIKGIILLVLVAADIFIDYENAMAFHKQISEGVASGSLLGYFSLFYNNSFWDYLDKIAGFLIIGVIVFSMYKASEFADEETIL